MTIRFTSLRGLIKLQQVTVRVAQIRRAPPLVFARRNLDFDAALFELSHDIVEIADRKTDMILAREPVGRWVVPCVNQNARVAHFEDCQTIFTMRWLGIQKLTVEISH